MTIADEIRSSIYLILSLFRFGKESHFKSDLIWSSVVCESNSVDDALISFILWNQQRKYDGTISDDRNRPQGTPHTYEWCVCVYICPYIGPYNYKCTGNIHTVKFIHEFSSWHNVRILVHIIHTVAERVQVHWRIWPAREKMAFLLGAICNT